MKIRTDFVTNSSSSSFVAITLHLKDGTKISAEYGGDGWNAIGEEFNPSKKYFESLNSCEKLVNDAINWYCESIEHSLSKEEAIEIFAEKETPILNETDLTDVKKIQISSYVDYEEFKTGSDITYNFETKKRTRRNTGYSSWEE